VAGGHVLLVHRPPHGVWGGLWSLPEYPHRGALPQVTAAYRRRLEAWCAREFGLRVAVDGDALPAFTHAFTHFDLDIRPLLAERAFDDESSMDGARYVWYNPLKSASATVGVPAAVAKIFASLKHTSD